MQGIIRLGLVLFAALMFTSAFAESEPLFARSPLNDKKDKAEPTVVQEQMQEEISDQCRAGMASGEPDRLDSRSPEFWYRRERK